MSDDVLARLARMPRITALLARLCDFSPLQEAPPGWFALEPNRPFEVFGRDASGGRFLHLPAPPEPQAVLYVSSKGEAGAIAETVEEALAMMAALPYWRDCLKFSRGGELAAMYAAAEQFEEALRTEEPKIARLRQDILIGLRRPSSAAPLERLHEMVRRGSGVAVVSATDRTAFASLFNTFSV